MKKIVFLAILIVLLAACAPTTQAHPNPEIVSVSGKFDSVYVYRYSTDDNKEHVREIVSDVTLKGSDDIEVSIGLSGVWYGDLPKQGELVALSMPTGDIKDLVITSLETGKKYRFVNPGDNKLWFVAVKGKLQAGTVYLECSDFVWALSDIDALLKTDCTWTDSADLYVEEVK